MQKLLRSLVAIGVVAGLAACGDDVTVTQPAAGVTSVTVSPPSPSIGIGASIQFAANVQVNGNTATTVNWTSSNPAVATVDANGKATAVALGTTSIVATSTVDASKSGAASLTVIAAPQALLTFSVTPNVASLVAGGTQTTATIETHNAGAAVTFAATSSNPAVATVTATGANPTITAVAPGTAVITITASGSGTGLASNQLAAAVAVTVTAQPSALQTLTVTPTTVNIGPGSAQQVVTTTTQASGATVTYANVSSNPAVATVTTTGGNPTITGVASGTAVVTITATGSGTGLTTNSLSQTVTVNVLAATLSINSITAGAGQVGAGLPVTLSNVFGQIDINLNFQPNGLGIDSVVVSINQPARSGVSQAAGFKRAAKQNFGNTVPAAGIITLSVNTANFAKDAATGRALVDYVNGQTTILAQIFPHNASGGTAVNCSNSPGDPNCAAPVQMVLNNVDGWAADLTKPTAAAKINVGGAAATLGSTYWGGPGAAGATNAEIYPVIYNDNPTFASGSALNRCSNAAGDGTGCISLVTWTVGTPAVGSDGTCNTITQGPAAPVPTTQPFQTSFGSGGTVACGYQNVVLLRDNIDITAAIDGTNNPFPTVGTPSGAPAPANPNTTLIPNTVVFGATPDSLRMDYVGPAVVAPQVQGSESFFWVNGAWAFKPAGVLVTDGGVGPLASSWAAFASLNGGGAAFPTPVATGADLAETNQNCVGGGCDGYLARATATDLLGNPANSGVTASFGDDRTAPNIRYAFTTGAAPAACGGCGLPSIYTGGGTDAQHDSTTYNAFEGLYGVNVVAAGAQTLFVSTGVGLNDTIRTDALDNRSGLSRAVITQLRFAQGTAAPGVGTGCSTSVGAFGASFADGWRPGPQIHITCGLAAAGYYTTQYAVVDRAGNTSPLLGTGSSTSIRRTYAIDPAQPLVTGVSPNNSYTGNVQETWSLGSQNDLEVIDARLRILYPNVTVGDAAGTVPVGTGGLVWSYATSNTFMGSTAGLASGPFSAGTASGTGVNWGFFSPIGTRWDASIVNPQVSTLTQDQFTLNVQETCRGAGSPPVGAATGPTTAAGCVAPAWSGDPILTTDIPLASPSTLGVQVRDVWGSWIFNTVAGAATGVSSEFTSPILPATVAAPGAFSVGYTIVAPGCPAGGGAPGGPCVTSGLNFRQDGSPSASVRNFRATEAISVTLPTFKRVELYWLDPVSGAWVFVQRCDVPTTIIPNTGAQACANGGGTVLGTDNGLERYWVYSFTGIPALPASQFRALGVNSSGFGLFSTVQP